MLESSAQLDAGGGGTDFRWVSTLEGKTDYLAVVLGDENLGQGAGVVQMCGTNVLHMCGANV